MNGLAKLTGTIKHYDWGGRQFIPGLLHLKEVPDKPFAEYWLGVHPQADCRLHWQNGKEESLREFMKKNAAEKLGVYVWKNFGYLPYLFKALDVKDMLSIQVHPSKAAAKMDFEAENKKGIPLDAPQRNYKDNNHKPELMLAMGPFWLLHGFRPQASMTSILSEKASLNFLLPVFEKDGYSELYRLVMEMPQEEVNTTLQPLLDSILPSYHEGKLDKMHPDFWAARAAITYNQPGKIDRGIFSVYLFNLVLVQKGEAVFQDAGLPHAYLEGQNIEIMASSDNVLRGGLTTKHIDVNELLRHVRCEPTEPNILKGELHNKWRVYKTPAPDFELSSLTITKGEELEIETTDTEIYLLTNGELLMEENGNSITLKPGEPAAIQLANSRIRLKALANSLIFKAGVPVISE